MKLKLRLDIILAVIICITPMIQYLNLILRGVVFSILIFLFWLPVVLFKHTKGLKAFGASLILHGGQLMLMLFFVLIVFINYIFISKNPYALQHLVTFLFYIIVLIISCYYGSKPKDAGISILIYLIILLGIQAAISIPYMLSASSMTVRLFSSGQLDEQQSLEAIRNGVGTNGLYTSLAPLVFIGLGILFSKSIKRRIVRLLLLVSIVSITLTIIMSTYFTSILMLTISALLFLLLTKGKSVFSLSTLSIIVLISVSLLTFYNLYLADTTLLYPIEKRVSGLFDSSSGSTSPRQELAGSSMKTFFNNPIFGIGVPPKHSYHLVGEHLPWLDNFAQFGLAGFTPFVFFVLLRISKNIKLYFLNDEFRAYRRACVIGVIIFIISNFASPLILTPNMYIIFILFYTNLELLSSNPKKMALNRRTLPIRNETEEI